jgi:BirA family transcriptional regulator, biotin operon repressor / biotin---[acetyl-CoA-carboxylase] ligase
VTERPGWPDGYGLRRFGSIDSTNEEAKRLAASGEAGPLWIVAREQTEGRGRRGRAWVSQTGNLFATLFTKAALPGAAQLSFVAALAAAEALEAYAPAQDIRLKWPNDVLLNGRKTSGILLESCGNDRVAIGIGINLASHPQNTEFPATCVVAEIGFAPEPEDLLPRLARRMAAWYEMWHRDGFAPVRAAWSSRAQGVGLSIRVRLAEREMEGLFEDIDDEGALLLKGPSGARTRITAGDVFFPA